MRTDSTFKTEKPEKEARGSGQRNSSRESRSGLRRAGIAAAILCCVLIAAVSGMLLFHGLVLDGRIGSGQIEPAAAQREIKTTEEALALKGGMSASPVNLSSTGGRKGAEPVSLWSVITRAVTRGSIHRESVMSDYYGNRYYDVVVNDRVGANDEEDTASISFKLDGNYTRLTGTLFRNEEHWTERGPYPFVKIYCDGYLAGSASLNAREGPYDFDIDLSGVKILRIEFDCILSYGYAGALANCMITPRQSFTPPTMTSNPKTAFGKAFRDYLDNGTSMVRSKKVDLILDTYNNRLKNEGGRKVLKDGFTETRYNTGGFKLVYNYADGILYAVSIYDGTDWLYFLAYWDGALIGIQDFKEVYGESWISPDSELFAGYASIFTYVDPYSVG